MLEELWREVHNTVQEAVTKAIPKQKKCRKTKWLSEEAVLRKEEKLNKGEKERYTHLNAEFQRIPRKDKNDFLSDQCKEIEGKNRMGKTRDLFKKNHRYQGNISCKMGSIKDRHGMGITEAEDIKR